MLEGYTTEMVVKRSPLVTKVMLMMFLKIFQMIKNPGATIDSFKKNYKKYQGVTNNGDITSTTYNTFVSGINAKLIEVSDTMTGTLRIGSDGVTRGVTTSGTINTKSNITSNGAY